MQLQNRKVVIIGAGHVGSPAGFTLIAQGLVDEIVYIDVDEKKALAQALDLADSTAYLPSRAKVRVGTYADAADAPLMIVAAGPLPDLATGQTRMDTLRQTTDLIHSGPERLERFDETMFADLVEKITVESMTRIRFRLYGGIELTEQIREVGR